MQIGSVVLNYNKNKEQISFFDQILSQYKKISKDFSIINIKTKDIQNYNRKWHEVILFN